jgi:hypothetical protein
MRKKKTQWGVQVGKPNMKYWQNNKHKLAYTNQVPDLWNVGRFIHLCVATRKEARIIARRYGKANRFWTYHAVKRVE